MELKLVNDTAERGIAYIQSYNFVLIKHEGQKQYLLQVIQKHRQRFPNPNKTTSVRKLF